MFDDEFLASIADRPYAAALEICTRVIEKLSDDEQAPEWTASEYDALREGYAVLDAMIKAELIPQLALLPHLVGDCQEDSREISKFIRIVQNEITAKANLQKLEQLQARASRMLGTGFSYEFTQGDLDQIQELIATLRKQITESEFFTDEHRRRLLVKLEKLQVEIHKKMSDLNRFWAMAGEAGVVLGKFGKDAKPIVDRIRELVGIAWRAQARAEDLPSDSSLTGLGADLLTGPNDEVEL